MPFGIIGRGRRVVARSTDEAGDGALERSASAGASRLLHDLRHRRERFRQFAGIVLAIVIALASSPSRTMLLTGVLPFVVGTAIRLWASGHVKKDKVLATDGPYGHVRHPLYVGNILILLGFCLASGTWWPWLASALLFVLFYPPAIAQEDGKLRRLFGADWDTWSAEVRALVPRFRPFEHHGTGGWSFRQSLMQNGEPIIAVFLSALFYLMYLKLD